MATGLSEFDALHRQVTGNLDAWQERGLLDAAQARTVNDAAGALAQAVTKFATTVQEAQATGQYSPSGLAAVLAREAATARTRFATVVPVVEREEAKVSTILRRAPSLEPSGSGYTTTAPDASVRQAVRDGEIRSALKAMTGGERGAYLRKVAADGTDPETLAAALGAPKVLDLISPEDVERIADARLKALGLDVDVQRQTFTARTIRGLYDKATAAVDHAAGTEVVARPQRVST